LWYFVGGICDTSVAHSNAPLSFIQSLLTWTRHNLAIFACRAVIPSGGQSGIPWHSSVLVAYVIYSLVIWTSIGAACYHVSSHRLVELINCYFCLNSCHILISSTWGSCVQTTFVRWNNTSLCASGPCCFGSSFLATILTCALFCNMQFITLIYSCIAVLLITVWWCDGCGQLVCQCDCTGLACHAYSIRKQNSMIGLQLCHTADCECHMYICQCCFLVIDVINTWCASVTLMSGTCSLMYSFEQ